MLIVKTQSNRVTINQELDKFDFLLRIRGLRAVRKEVVCNLVIAFIIFLRKEISRNLL